MNRRSLLAGAAAVPLAAVLPALPAAPIETVAPVMGPDRAAVAARFHRWAFYCPELGDRIDAMLARLDYILSTGEGTGEFLEVVEMSRTQLGRDVSIDWLICGEGAYANGVPRLMFHDDPPAEPLDVAKAGLLRDFRACSAENRAGIMELARAMARDDYAAARHWSDYLNRLAGITVAQV